MTTVSPPPRTGKTEKTLLDVLKDEGFWPYKRWTAKALVAQGQKGEAVRLAGRLLQDL